MKLPKVGRKYHRVNKYTGKVTNWTLIEIIDMADLCCKFINDSGTTEMFILTDMFEGDE